MKFALLSYSTEYEHRDMDYISFSGDETILEYDVVILCLDDIFCGYKSYYEYEGFPKLTEHDSIRIKKDIDKRKKELVEFLNSGKNIIVVGGNDKVVYRYTGNRSISGTGKNAKTTHYVTEVHTKEILPITINSINLSGKAITFFNKKVENVLASYSNYFNYKTIYENVNSNNVLMTVKGTNKVVSFYERVGKGTIIFVPGLYFEDLNHKKEVELEKNYFKDLANINNVLIEKSEELPDYSKEYLLPGEKELIDVIQKTKDTIQKLENSLENKESILKTLQQEKITFTGTGTALEIRAVELLENIGFKIEKYDPNSVDEDIIISYNDNVAVIEVKGVTGSAAEKYTSQVVKWKSEYHIEHDRLPKGILLVNAFCNKKLEERQEYFPNQMLKYAKQQEICLITSMQLYNITEYIKEKPNEKEKIINQIYETIGLFKGFEDWNLYINKK